MQWPVVVVSSPSGLWRRGFMAPAASINSQTPISCTSVTTAQSQKWMTDEIGETAHIRWPPSVLLQNPRSEGLTPRSALFSLLDIGSFAFLQMMAISSTLRSDYVLLTRVQTLQSQRATLQAIWGDASGSCFVHDNQLFYITYHGTLYQLDIDEKHANDTQTSHKLPDNGSCVGYNDDPHKHRVLPPDLVYRHRHLGFPSDVVTEPSGTYYWLIGGVGEKCGLRRLDFCGGQQKPLVVLGWDDYRAVKCQKLVQLHNKLYTLSWQGAQFHDGKTVVYEHDVLSLDANIEDETKRPKSVVLQAELGTRPIDMMVHDDLLIVANENGDIYGMDPLAQPSQRTRKLLDGATYRLRAEAAMCSGVLSRDTRVLHATIHDALCHFLVDDVLTLVRK